MSQRTKSPRTSGGRIRVRPDVAVRLAAAIRRTRDLHFDRDDGALAEMLGTSSCYVDDLCCERYVPGLEVVIRLAEYLKVSVDDLLFGSET